MRRDLLVFRIGVLVVAIVIGAVSSSTAFAQSNAECLRDSDCPGAEICPDRECETPETEPSSCESRSDCLADEQCDDGYCKFNGVACDNGAGICEISRWGGSCRCRSGESDAWTAEDTSTVLPDDVARDLCESALVETCGEGDPELPAGCVDERKAVCEAFAAASSAYSSECEPSDPIVDPLLLCCERLEMEADATLMFECFSEISPEDCEAAEVEADRCEELSPVKPHEEPDDTTSGDDDGEDVDTSKPDTETTGGASDEAADGAGRQGCRATFHGESKKEAPWFLVLAWLVFGSRVGRASRSKIQL